MNEVVSASYTLTVYGATEHRLSDERIKRVIERLLELTRFKNRDPYHFKVLKLYSNQPTPTFEFRHESNELVDFYRCHVGNVAGMKGIYKCLLQVPMSAFHGGMTETFNTAAVKLLAEIRDMPEEVRARAETVPEEVTKLPTTESAPLPQATAAACSLLFLSLTEQSSPSPTTKGKRTRKQAEKRAAPKTHHETTVRQPSLLSRLSTFERTVRKERAIAKKELVAATTKLAALDSLVAELKEKKTVLKHDRLLRNRLKKMR